MHESEKSDSVVVAGKPTNKTARAVAEPVEPRTGTKGNADQQSTHRAQDRESVSQALERLRQAARQRKTLQMEDALSGNVAEFSGFDGMESVLTCAKPVEQCSASGKRLARCGRVSTPPMRATRDSPLKIRFAPDSPLEGTGFEPSVPLRRF